TAPHSTLARSRACDACGNCSFVRTRAPLRAATEPRAIRASSDAPHRLRLCRGSAARAVLRADSAQRAGNLPRAAREVLDVRRDAARVRRHRTGGAVRAEESRRARASAAANRSALANRAASGVLGKAPGTLD